MIDLSAWRMVSSDGDLMHLRPDRVWNSSSMIIAPGERFVFTTPNWFISGLGDSISLQNPDGAEVDFAGWSITTDCKTMNGNGEVLPWPTPGEEEPEGSNQRILGGRQRSESANNWTSMVAWRRAKT